MGKVRPLNPGIVQRLGKELGPVIAELRRKKQMAPVELAARAGVDPKAVEHWEKGRRIINNESLPRVAHALETRPSQIYARAERRGGVRRGVSGER
jgi:transcriptional regulator with XRE-family HTH domain